MTPDIHELVENIKSVLKSDEEHMEEAVTSASFLEQVVSQHFRLGVRQVPHPHRSTAVPGGEAGQGRGLQGDRVRR